MKAEEWSAELKIAFAAGLKEGARQEREACAKVAEESWRTVYGVSAFAAEIVAASIRARTGENHQE